MISERLAYFSGLNIGTIQHNERGQKADLELLIIFIYYVYIFEK